MPMSWHRRISCSRDPMTFADGFPSLFFVARSIGRITRSPRSAMRSEVMLRDASMNTNASYGLGGLSPDRAPLMIVRRYELDVQLQHQVTLCLGEVVELVERTQSVSDWLISDHDR